MKKALFLVLVVATCATVFKARIKVGTTNLSGQEIEEPLSIMGPVNASGARLTSLDVLGPTTLENSVVTSKICVTGPLTCKYCTLEDVNQTGPTTYHHTTVQGHVVSTGTLDAQHSSFGPITNQGVITLNDTKVEGMLKNTGSNALTNTTFDSAHLIGRLTAKHSTGKKLSVTGSTRLNHVTLDHFDICGKTNLSSTHAKHGSIIGSINAKKCSINHLTVTTEKATLTDCSSDTLHILKEASAKHHPVVTIYASKKEGSKHQIKKIMCDDPETRIIYGPNTAPADEITGTTNITYA